MRVRSVVRQVQQQLVSVRHQLMNAMAALTLVSLSGILRRVRIMVVRVRHQIFVMIVVAVPVNVRIMAMVKLFVLMG